MTSGRILRLQADGLAQTVSADAGGGLLGMAFDISGKLIVADAIKGLLSVKKAGKVSTFVAGGTTGAASFPNAVLVAASGKIYLTDSSRCFHASAMGRHAGSGHA